jgi:cation-transporting ATPase E
MKKQPLTAAEVERFSADTMTGLDESQVAVRKQQGLTNKVERTVGKSYAAIFLGNIFTFFNMLGLAIMVLMLILGSFSNVFFAVVILANTFIGIIQEIKAKKSIEKLSIMSAPTANAVRGGSECEIAVSDLVLDDVIKLSAGKQIAADCQVLDGEIEVNEALLTGESVAIKKKKGDSLLSGSFVVSGNCFAKVEHVGKDNYVEKLSAKAKKYQKPNSQLMRSINTIIKALAVVIFPLGIGTFCTAYFRQGIAVEQSLILMSGSMIGMIPSGMVLLTSVALAVSVIKLARNNALVQDLYCIEMLARVNVLCLDKTGTITDGTMTVEEVKILDGSKNFASLMANFLTATGDANQSAVAMANEFGKKDDLKANAVIAFSSARKYSAASFDGVGTVAVGAPGFVMQPSESTAKIIENFAKQGKRVLLAGTSQKNIVEDKLPQLTETALIVIEDTVRADAVEIIDWLKNNNVAVKVISGDNPLTVSVIAGKVGIENANKYISLEGLSDAEVIEAAAEYTVFGRVNPDQKALLIKTIRANGNTVAMTGDGVNDILAMKEADCAVAIAAGSEAARSVAHLVLMDSKFSSMPKVVKEGRQVVNNIQNSSSLFLMKTTMTIFTTVLMIILGLGYPFEPKNLYIIEFMVIGIPSFVLALRTNTDLIKGKFISNTLLKTIPSGIALSLSVGIIYLYAGLKGLPFTVVEVAEGIETVVGNPEVITLATMAMTLSGVIALCVMCYPYTWITISVAAGSAVLSVLCFVITPLGKFMDFTSIAQVSPHLWIVTVCLAISLAVIAVGRFIMNKKVKN